MVSLGRVRLVQEFFRPLNPYSNTDSEMFKVEDHADHDGFTHSLSNVLFYGISSKGYALLEINDASIVTIRKHSSHGLGHLEGIDEEEWWRAIIERNYYPNRVS